MNDSYGDYTGHSMAMVYERHESETYNWPASCLSCHEDGGMEMTWMIKAPVLMAEIEGLWMSFMICWLTQVSCIL